MLSWRYCLWWSRLQCIICSSDRHSYEVNNCAKQAKALLLELIIEVLPQGNSQILQPYLYSIILISTLGPDTSSHRLIGNTIDLCALFLYNFVQHHREWRITRIRCRFSTRMALDKLRMSSQSQVSEKHIQTSSFSSIHLKDRCSKRGKFVTLPRCLSLDMLTPTTS